LLDDYGIEVAGGLGPLAGKILRIGVMGPLATEANLDLFFEAFGQCMAVHATA
jgi:alanine-glyoxylate transaminase/serine-glyoxylate transaminase/serine-pyruvate transaminase